jgi:hypothetical protein
MKGNAGLFSPEVHFSRGLSAAQRRHIEARDRAELKR